MVFSCPLQVQRTTPPFFFSKKGLRSKYEVIRCSDVPIKNPDLGQRCSSSEEVLDRHAQALGSFTLQHKKENLKLEHYSFTESPWIISMAALNVQRERYTDPSLPCWHSPRQKSCSNKAGQLLAKENCHPQTQMSNSHTFIELSLMNTIHIQQMSQPFGHGKVTLTRHSLSEVTKILEDKTTNE